MSEDDLTELDQEQLNDERLRRMKVLMRQLYREEFEAKSYRLPPIKGKTLILFVSFLSIIVFGVTTLYNYNRFITLEEHILSSRGHVETAIQYRANLFSNLFNLALNHADVEREVFHFVAEKRTELSGIPNRDLNQDLNQDLNRGSMGPGAGAGSSGTGAAGTGDVPTAPTTAMDMLKAGAKSIGGLSDTISRLLAIVERYPDIKSATTYQMLMDKLVGLEERVVVRRDETNEAIRIYNTLISTFPWYVLAKATGFTRHEYYLFNINDTLVSADVFDRLLPSPSPYRNRILKPVAGPVEPDKAVAP